MDDVSLFVVAGDPSGDNATERVAALLIKERPDLKLVGLGGPRLKALGQVQLADSADLAVLGFWEVAKRYLFFRRLFKECVAEIKKIRPRAILLVDYPGFNLRLAQAVRSLGIPVVYYISPQVWAWGKGRVTTIRDNVDQMLAILPFEESFFRQHDIDCQFVGHYLLEDIPEEYIGSPVPGNGRLALLPGSRPQEIERMLPAMLEAAALYLKRCGGMATVAGLSGVYDYEKLCQTYAEAGITVEYDTARRIVYESDLVLTASGTATLETGIIGRPMVVVYKSSFLTYQIARRLVTLDNVALVNLVLGERCVPELIQGEATPEKMAVELERYQNDPNYADQTATRLRQVPALLGGVGASARAATMIGKYLC